MFWINDVFACFSENGLDMFLRHCASMSFAQLIMDSFCSSIIHLFIQHISMFNGMKHSWHFSPNQAKLNGLPWKTKLCVCVCLCVFFFFFLPVVSTLGSGWFIIITFIGSNDFDCLLELPLYFFTERKNSCFFWC